MISKQPWLHSKWVDSVFILMPPFVVLAIIVLFSSEINDVDYVSPILWIVLVMGIDVSHVYSTLYRTYFSLEARKKYRTEFLFVPIGCLLVGVLLHTINYMLFWRCLAYLAVFHFIRQQYGFLRLYSRNENNSSWKSRIDAFAVYASMLYPMIFWHFSGDRNFTWFVEGDFILSDKTEWIITISFFVYVLLMVVFTVTEILSIIKTHQMNLPKLAVVAGTALSWYFGIVYYNGDLTFTALNVIAHGIPYIALVWIYGNKQLKKNQSEKSKLSIFFRPAAIVLFILPLLMLAYLEEGFWDALVWQDHKEVFSGFSFLPALHDKSLLSLIVPLLALPQMTHYVLDGFIWKVSKPDVQAELGIKV